MESEEKKIIPLEPNVDYIRLGEREIFLVGTAHVSKSSAEQVQRVIEQQRPQVVCLELCQPRYESLTNPKRWREMNVYDVIRSGKAYVVGAQLALASFQKRLAKQLGIQPGQEMRQAIASAKAHNAEIHLIDREVKTTLKRAWGNASLWSMLKLGSGLFGSLFSSEQITEKEIEDLKGGGDALTALMGEFAEVLPGVKEVLINERDLYMAHKLAHAPGSPAVAVVGAGHCPGIKKAIGSLIDIDALETLPKKRKFFSYLAWGLPVLILGLIVWGFYNSGTDTSLEMIQAWVLVNGTLAALGTIIALAHPLTIITAFIAAPITSLNPAIAAGTVAGLVEAVVRKPQVSDLENIGEDISSLRGFWSNRVTKVLLVFFFANLGSSIGTLLGVGWIASLL